MEAVITHNNPEAGPIITSEQSPWEAYLSHGVKRDYKANVTLLHPYEPAEYLYYVQKGEVLVSNFASPNSGTSRLFIMREKTIVGLIGMFTPNTVSATWLTLKPCTLYLFDKNTVYNHLPRTLYLTMLEQLGAMSSAMSRRFAQGLAKRLDMRLAQFLLHIIGSCPKVEDERSHMLIVKPNITQEMASELTGMHPVTLNRLLAAFRAEGIVGRFTKHCLEIKDMDALIGYAEEKMPQLGTNA